MRKRNLLWGLLGLSMVFASCQKQEGPTLAPNASLTVTIPQEAVQTRATGDGSQVTRCVMQVYRNDAPYGEKQVVAVSGSTATFTDLQLVASQTYKFVFWADCGTGSNNLEDNHYNTSDLTNITVKGDYIGNNEEFDAFFKCEELTVTDAFSHEVTLARPFGQLNVKTNDLDAIGEGHDDLKPTHVTVNFSAVPTTFNALTGETGSPLNLSYTAEVVDNAGHLTLDYIWAEEDQANLADFSMEFLNSTGNTIAENDNFHNIPIRRNYQTNVSGNLLTKKGTINVTIDPGFAAGGIESQTIEVASGNLKSTLAGLTTEGIKDYNIVVLDNGVSGEYELPALSEGSSISIQLAGASAPVTFGDADFKGMFEVCNTGSAVDLTINVPQGDATLGAGSWNSITATTKPGTFTIASGADVTKVTINGGNVNVNKGAEVGEIVRGENNTDEETVVTLFDGATVTTIDENITTQEGVTGQIVNKSTGKSYATIRDAVTYASAGDVIEIAAGSYDLGEPGQKDATGPYGYYLKIDTPVTLKGLGDVTITTSHEAAQNIGGVGCLQNLVTVNADNVTLENLTFVANYNNAYGGPNKVVLVQGTNATVKNCVFKTNEKAPEDGGSAVYFALNARKGLVEGCTTNYATISFDGLMDGEFDILNNTFNYGNTNLVFTTPNWTSNDVTTSTLKVNVENNTFTGVEAYTGENNPVVRAYYGIINLKGNKFPTDDIYWKATKFGSIFVDYNSLVDQYWFKDRSEPMSFAISNDVIEFATAQEPNNNWYSWQGRKAKVNNGVKSSWTVETTLTIPTADRPVRQSVWLNVCNAEGRNADWAIVGYKIAEAGQVGVLETWDSSGEGVWNEVKISDLNLNPGDQAAVKFVFENGTMTQFVNGIQVNQYAIDGVTASQLSEIIYNSYSYGDSYNTTWSYPVVK